jgi:Protein of unknown function (DUF4238)
VFRLNDAARDRRLQERAIALSEALDPKAHVGDKHHIVPMMILKRFADANGRVLVRDRITGAARDQNINDLAIKDFYSFIDNSGELDASFEDLWGQIEGDAAKVLKLHVGNPFMQPRPFTSDEKATIDNLVALQLVRGPARRRMIELTTDYTIKLVNQHQLQPEDIESIEIAPHQNQILQALLGAMGNVAQYLQSREAGITELDRPLLVTCDEPVCFERPEGYKPPTPEGLNGYQNSIHVEGVPDEDIIQFSGSRGVGLGNARAIAMPLSPKHFLVYGGLGDRRPVQSLYLTGDQADEVAAELVGYCAEQAVHWIAASPNHPTLRDMELPEPLPILSIRDGGSGPARSVNRSKLRTPRRLDKSAWQEMHSR